MYMYLIALLSVKRLPVESCVLMQNKPVDNRQCYLMLSKTIRVLTKISIIVWLRIENNSSTGCLIFSNYPGRI